MHRLDVKTLGSLPLALLLCTAQAHPVDEVVQGAYLTLTPGRINLELDITPGSKVARPLVTALDRNADGQVTPTEARAYAAQVLNQSTLTLNTAAVKWTLDRVTVPPLDTLRNGDTLKIYATAPRSDTTGAQSLTYVNRYQPAKSQWIANIFLQPAGGWQYTVTGQTHSNDGRTLTVKYTTTRP